MRKVITFLGTGDYKPTIFNLENERGEKLEFETKYVQFALAKLLNDVKFYVALTEEAAKKNWLDDNGNGLKKEFDENGISYEEINIKDGKSEIEIWENFNIVFDVIEENDEIYVDITHSFRSLPLMVMSVLNYAKFTKNINIKKIYYGAYEAKTVDNHEPIFDLSLFNKLTDWSIAADKFLKTGYSKDLSDLIHEAISEKASESKEAQKLNKLQKKLNEFSRSLYTVRGKRISGLGMEIKGILTDLETITIDELKPLEKILKKIKYIFEPFTGDIVLDIHHSAKLCADFNLVYQAYTLIRENIVNYVASSLNMDLSIRKNREEIEDSLNGKNDGFNSNIEKFVDDDIRELFDCLRDLRNTLAHAGFNENSPKESKIYCNLKMFIREFEDQFLTKYKINKGL